MKFSPNEGWQEFFRECFYEFIRERPPLRSGEVCCSMMRANIEDQCDWRDGAHPYGQCPDQVVVKKDHGYGLPIQDGGGSYIEIRYCPWCARKLPKS